MAQLMVASVYDALKEAGASEEKSRAAAEDLAGFEDRFNHVDKRFDHVERRIDGLEAKLTNRIDSSHSGLAARIDNVETKLEALGQRMNIQFGILGAAVAAILVRSFL